MTKSSRDFSTFLEQRIKASDAFVRGEFGPLEAVSTHSSPTTLFSPKGDVVSGADEVNAVNAESAKLFKPSSENAFEVIHSSASDTLAYWVGIQRSVVQMHGQDAGIPMNLRLTEIYRLEAEDWKLIHRHADVLAEENPT